MDPLSGDFIVGRLAPPGTRLFSPVFAIEPRPETTLLVKINDQLIPCRLRIKVGGVLIDPEA